MNICLLRGCKGRAPLPMGVKPPGIVHSATMSTIRMLAVLSSQLLLCRPLNCSYSVHPTLTNFLFLCLGDFVSYVFGRCCALDSCEPPSLYRMQSVELRLDTLPMR